MPCESTPSLGPQPRNYRCDELHDCNQDCAITCIGVACSDAAALADDTAEGAKPIRELCHLTRGPVIFSLYVRVLIRDRSLIRITVLIRHGQNERSPDFTGCVKTRDRAGKTYLREPQGLKPEVFSIIYGTTKVVP